MFPGFVSGLPGSTIPSCIHPANCCILADTLSRAPQQDHDLLDEVDRILCGSNCEYPTCYHTATGCLSEGTSRRLCHKVMDYCHTQWPQKSPTDPLLGLYWKVRDSLSIHNDLLMYNLRIVVPLSLQKETLQKVHEGHQGIVRCRMRTKMSVRTMSKNQDQDENQENENQYVGMPIVQSKDCTIDISFSFLRGKETGDTSLKSNQ